MKRQVNRNRAIALLSRPLDFLRPDENLDRRIALAGMGASVIVLVWNFATRQSLLNYEVGFVLLLASGVYLLLRRRMPSASDPSTTTERPEQGQSTRNRLRALYIVFLVLFTTSLIVLHQSLYSRPIAVLAMAAIMSGILALEIAICRNQRSALFILLQVLALGMLLRASVYYQYSGVPGNDPWYFLDFVEKLNAQGKIGDFGDYSGFPGMPVFVTSIAQVSGLGVRHSFFLVGAVEGLSLVFIYLVGKAVRSEKIGLLSALLLAVASQHLLWGYYIIANGFCLALMPIVVFLLFAGWRRIAWGSLIIVIGLTMIISHSITAIMLLCVLVSTFIGGKAFSLGEWRSRNATAGGPPSVCKRPGQGSAVGLQFMPEPEVRVDNGTARAMPSTVAMVCITAACAVAIMLYWRYASGTYERILANIYVGASSVATGTGPAATVAPAATNPAISRLAGRAVISHPSTFISESVPVNAGSVVSCIVIV